MQSNILGWDIGGAHLKAAMINSQGSIVQVMQKPCPLWMGLPELSRAVAEIRQDLAELPANHAITMTGELADCFASRADGVQQIIQHMEMCLPEADILIYAGIKGFIKPEQLSTQHFDYIASANWMASASYAAKKINSGLFIDIGSTTTDILLIDNHQVITDSYTDYQRLCNEELIYTGIVRTPVMALADKALFQGHQVGLMAEHFATMADVYRLTGELDERHDQTPSADGAEKSITGSARRLSRMIGCDFAPQQIHCWQQFAGNIRELQIQKIQDGCARQLSRRLLKQPVVIGAGIGRFLIKPLAERLGCDYSGYEMLFGQQLPHTALTIADCAPAVAVARLAKAA